MSLSTNLEIIAQLAETVASRNGLVLVDVRLGQLGRKRSLEVTIFRPGGRVNLDDCQAVSRQLDKELDSQVPPVLSGAFLLEVQSPGIERQLSTEREFKVFVGETVAIKARENIGSLGQAFQGTLLGSAGGRITIGNPKPLKSGAESRAVRTTGSPAAVTKPAEEIDLDLKKLVRINLYPTESYSSSKLPQEKDYIQPTTTE